jgi:hypothetical protein
MLGAIGMLGRPYTAAALFRALRGLRAGPPIAPRVVLTPAGCFAEAIDPASGAAIVRWEIRDLSRSGALLLTHGPMAVGERLRLRIVVGRDVFEADAEVVRVQEPAWGVLPGVAVRFLALEARGRDGIRRHRSRSHAR